MDRMIQIDLGGVNCYLARGKCGFILFDTGGHIVTDREFTNRRELLIKELESLGCTEHNLGLIVLTHGDNDHACNAAYLRKRFKTKIAMHDGDRELVENPTLHKMMESFQYDSAELQQVFLQYRQVITTATQKALDDFERFSPDIILKDGFDFSPYGFDATVIHMPGHTPGSIAVLTKSGDLIAGDTLANTEKPAPARNASDFGQLSASIRKLQNYTIKSVYPGHGNPFPFQSIL